MPAKKDDDKKKPTSRSAKAGLQVRNKKALLLCFLRSSLRPE